MFGAATATAAGTNGLVQGAAINEQAHLLRADRTWQNPSTLPITAATTTAIASAVASLVASSPATLDTLNELALALGNNPNFATTITNLLANKVNLTGNETIGGIKTFSNLTQSTSSTTGALVISTGGLGVGGFTTLGEQATGIKTKIITGTTPATQNTYLFIPHGLVGGKIRGLQAIIQHGINAGILNNLVGKSGYNFECYYDSINITIYTMASNSANILSKPFTVLITYIA